MLTSILTPAGGRSSTRFRREWLRLACLHSIGAVATATAMGLLLAGLAWLCRRQAGRAEAYLFWVAAGLASLYLPRTLGWIKFPPLVQSTRQVPRTWAYDYPRRLTALLFGLGLGPGCYTRIVVPTYYLLVVWPFLGTHALVAVGIWSVYGLVRSGNLWLLALREPADGMADAGGLFSRLTDYTWTMRYANAGALLVAALWAVWRGVDLAGPEAVGLLP